jgi:cold shock CspA family protein
MATGTVKFFNTFITPSDGSRDVRRQKLIAAVLADFTRLTGGS